MEKNSYTSSSNWTNLWKCLPKAFILFVCMFLITECLVASFFKKHITNSTNIKIREKIQLAKSESSKGEILIFGDSVAAGSINANEMENKTGLGCFNLSLVGNATVAGNYLLLRDYLKNNIAPKYIVMMNAYDVWQRSPDKNSVVQLFAINYPQIIREGFTWQAIFSESSKNKVKIFKNIVVNIVPSLLYKHEIKRMFKGIHGFISDSLAETEKIQNDLYLNKGSSIYSENDHEITEKDLRDSKKYVETNNFIASKWNSYFLSEFLKEADSRNITVFVSYPPLCREYYNDVIDNKYFDSYRYFIQEIKSNYDNVIFLNDDFYIVGKDDLSKSKDHINDKASVVFTGVVAKKILEHACAEEQAKTSQN